MYASNTGAHKHVMQTLTDIKEESDNNTVIVGDFITLNHINEQIT